MLEGDDPGQPAGAGGLSAAVPVTLNCSGGIALGAYMAGAFSELVQAALRPRAAGAAAAIRIDTITGASAGAMTGLIAARYLLQDPQAALVALASDGEEQPTNGFHRAWVQLADIRALTSYRGELQTYFHDDGPGPGWPRLGLLSGQSIAEITECVAGTWSDADFAGMASALERGPLALLFTVTNLQGLLRASPGPTPATAGPLAVSHAETRRFLFHRQMAELTQRDATALARRWDKAKVSVRASGAFPVAFPPLTDSSHADSPNIALDAAALGHYWAVAQKPDEPPQPDWICRLDPERPGPPQPERSRLELRLAYTDGGVLDGLPILKGVGLLHQLDGLRPGAGLPPESRADDPELQAFAASWFAAPVAEEARRFVYVQPLPVTRLETGGPLLRFFFPLLANGLAGLTYPRAEHDHLRLLEIERINQLVRQRDQLLAHPVVGCDDAARLRQVLPYRRVQLDPIHPVLPFQVGTAEHPLPFPALLLEVAAALRHRDPPPVPLSDGEALLAFERLLLGASQVDPRQAVSPAALLASDLLGAFGGFFHQDYRRHDYLIGRLSAMAWLLNNRLVEAEAMRRALATLLERSADHYLPEHRRRGWRTWLDGLRLVLLIIRRLPYVLVSDGFQGVFLAWPGRRARRWHAVLRWLVAPLASLLLGVAAVGVLLLLAVLAVPVGGVRLIAGLRQSVHRRR